MERKCEEKGGRRRKMGKSEKRGQDGRGGAKSSEIAGNGGKTNCLAKRKNGGEISKEFPNFAALTKEERLAFFEALSAARRNVERTGARARDRFGTVHDEYLDYFEGAPTPGAPSRGGDESSASSLTTQATYVLGAPPEDEGEANPTKSADSFRGGDFPSEDLFLLDKSACDLYAVASVSRDLLPDGERQDFEGEKISASLNEDSKCNSVSGDSASVFTDVEAWAECESVLVKDRDRIIDLYLKKKRAEREKCKGFEVKEGESEALPEAEANRSDQTGNQVSSGRPNKENVEPETRNADGGQIEAKTSTRTKQTPRFDALNPEEKEIFFNILKEARENVLQENPQNEIATFESILKRYQGEKDAVVAFSVPAEDVPKARIRGPKEARNLRVKLTLKSMDNQRLRTREGGDEKKQPSATEEAPRRAKSEDSLSAERKDKKESPPRPAEQTPPPPKKANHSEEGKETEAEPQGGKETQSKPQEGKETESKPEVGKETEAKPQEGKETESKLQEVKETESKPEENSSMIESKKSEEKKKEETAAAEERKASNEKKIKSKEKKQIKLNKRKRENAGGTKDSARNGLDSSEREKTGGETNGKRPEEKKESVVEKDKSSSGEASEKAAAETTMEKEPEKKIQDFQVAAEVGSARKSGKVEETEMEKQGSEEAMSEEARRDESEGRNQEIRSSLVFRTGTDESEKREEVESEECETVTGGKPEGEVDLNFPASSCSGLDKSKKSESELPSGTEEEAREAGGSRGTAVVPAEELVRVESVLSRAADRAGHAGGFAAGGRSASEAEEIDGRTEQVRGLVPDFTSGKVVVVDDGVIDKIKRLVQDLERKARREEDVLANEYVRLLLSYVDYLSRVLHSLMRAGEKSEGPRVSTGTLSAGSSTGRQPESAGGFQVRQSLTSPSVFLKFQENADRSLPQGDKRNGKLSRSVSHEGIARGGLVQDRSLVGSKETYLRGNDLDEKMSSLMVVSPSLESASTVDSEEDTSLVPMFVKKKKLPTTKIRVLQDLLKEKAAFVEGSYNDFKIVQLPQSEAETSQAPVARLNVEEEEEARSEKGPKSKFVKALVKFCRCGRKEVTDEVDILENLKGEAVAVDVSHGTKNPASVTLNESTLEVLKAAERKKIIDKYWKTS